MSRRAISAPAHEPGEPSDSPRGSGRAAGRWGAAVDRDHPPDSLAVLGAFTWAQVLWLAGGDAARVAVLRAACPPDLTQVPAALVYTYLGVSADPFDASDPRHRLAGPHEVPAWTPAMQAAWAAREAARAAYAAAGDDFAAVYGRLRPEDSQADDAPVLPPVAGPPRPRPRDTAGLSASARRRAARAVWAARVVDALYLLLVHHRPGAAPLDPVLDAVGALRPWLDAPTRRTAVARRLYAMRAAPNWLWRVRARDPRLPIGYPRGLGGHRDGTALVTVRQMPASARTAWALLAAWRDVAAVGTELWAVRDELVAVAERAIAARFRADVADTSRVLEAALTERVRVAFGAPRPTTPDDPKSTTESASLRLARADNAGHGRVTRMPLTAQGSATATPQHPSAMAMILEAIRTYADGMQALVGRPP